MRSLKIVVFLFFAVLTAISSTSEESSTRSRIALIIANSNYDSETWNLANPINDAKLMSEALTKVGFEVEVVLDANEDDMETAFKSYGERLTVAGPEAIGFFFYAGHGIQSDGINYLVPTDLEAVSEADIWSAPQLETLFRHLRRAANRTNFIVLDACRNNPLLQTRDLAGGLASVAQEDARGMLIAYATAPGKVAYDGQDNSPYSTALAETIVQPGISVETMFRIVATRVEERTDERQQPWTESGLRGEKDFCFVSCTGSLSRVEQFLARNDVPVGSFRISRLLDGFRTEESDQYSPSTDHVLLGDFLQENLGQTVFLSVSVGHDTNFSFENGLLDVETDDRCLQMVADSKLFDEQIRSIVFPVAADIGNGEMYCRNAVVLELEHTLEAPGFRGTGIYYRDYEGFFQVSSPSELPETFKTFVLRSREASVDRWELARAALIASGQ